MLFVAPITLAYVGLGREQNARAEAAEVMRISLQLMAVNDYGHRSESTLRERFAEGGPEVDGRQYCA